MDFICIWCNKQTTDRCKTCRVPVCDDACDGATREAHNKFCRRPPPPIELQNLFPWLALDIANRKLAGREIPQYTADKNSDPVLMVPLPGPILGAIPSFVVARDNNKEVAQWTEMIHAEASWHYFVRMDLLANAWLRFEPSQRNEMFSLMNFMGESLTECFEDMAVQIGNACTGEDVEQLKKKYELILPQIKTGKDFFDILAAAKAKSPSATGMCSFRELYGYKSIVVSKAANDKIRELMLATEKLKAKALDAARVKARTNPLEVAKFAPVPPSHMQPKKEETEKEKN